MRNKHHIDLKLHLRCPFEECGKDFIKHVRIEYITNQRGDVIEEHVL